MKKQRIKRSPIWLMPLDDFRDLVANNHTITAILAHFGMRNVGGNFRTLKARMQEENITTEHFYTRRENFKRPLTPLEDILVENSQWRNNQKLKARLIATGLLVNKCISCGLGPQWKNKTLVLTLDHENGISSDNRLCNLRILCPNCHSQTDTFAGRNTHGGIAERRKKD